MYPSSILAARQGTERALAVLLACLLLFSPVSIASAQDGDDSASAFELASVEETYEAVAAETDFEDESGFAEAVDSEAAAEEEPSDSELFGIVLADVDLSNSTPQVSVSNGRHPAACGGEDRAMPEGSSTCFRVTLSASPERPVAVEVMTLDGSATAGEDYEVVNRMLVFAVGTTTLAQDVSVLILADSIQESEEAFFLLLTNVANAEIVDGAGMARIGANDELTVSINSASAPEGQPVVFTVTLSAGARETVTVNYAAIGGTATAGVDYSQAAGTLVFDAGETQKTVSVPTLQDNLYEPTELFTVMVSEAVNATIAVGTGAGTIIDDDVPYSLSIGDVTVVEGVPAVFTVSLSAPPAAGQTVTVDYATSAGTAIGGAACGPAMDFVSVTSPARLTFTPGQTSKSISVTTCPDTVDEPAKTFFVDLVGASPNATISDTQGQATIADDDSSPMLSINDARGTEGTSITFTVSLSNASGEAVTYQYSTVDGTATGSTDYASASAVTRTIAAGNTSDTFTISTVADTAKETDETFAVRLQSATNATIVRETATATIVDDDGVPTLSISDGNAVASCGAGSGSVVEGTATCFRVSVSATSGQTITVEYSTSNGSAGTSDYLPARGTLTFAPGGSLSQDVTVSTTDDTSIETAPETFFVQLSNAINATISDGSGTGTITDNDAAAPAPTPTLCIEDTASVEGAAVVLDVSLRASCPTGATVATVTPVVVQFATSPGTATAGASCATAGVDYLTTSGPLVFNPGQTTRTISVTTCNDVADEGANTMAVAETFTVTLSGAEGAMIGDATGVGSILDND